MPLPSFSRRNASRSFAPAGIRETATLTLFRNLCSQGYAIVPVNPNAKETDGVPCYECVQELGPPVDTALVMTSADPAATVGREGLPVRVGASVERALDVPPAIRALAVGVRGLSKPRGFPWRKPPAPSS